MTLSSAIGSTSTATQAVPAHGHHHRRDGFDRQLQNAASGQVAQATTATTGGAGSLLSSDLLRQIQSLPGLAAATPLG